jgi:hypothetical protein
MLLCLDTYSNTFFATRSSKPYVQPKHPCEYLYTVPVPVHYYFGTQWGHYSIPVLSIRNILVRIRIRAADHWIRILLFLSWIRNTGISTFIYKPKAIIQYLLAPRGAKNSSESHNSYFIMKTTTKTYQLRGSEQCKMRTEHKYNKNSKH